MSTITSKYRPRSVRTLGHRTVGVLCVVSMVLFLTGCAVTGERQLAQSARAIERDVYAAGPATALATSPSDSLRTLDDLLRHAALRSPRLEAAFYHWKAAVERIPQVRTLPDPRFNFRYMIEEVETRVGPQQASVALMQTFPWFGKLRLAGEAAAQKAEAARRRYEAAKLALFNEVKDAWHEYGFWAQQVAITEDNLALLQQTIEVARTKYSAAILPHADLIKAQVELGVLEDRLASLRALQSPLVARLNAAIDRPVNAPLLPLPAAEVITDSDGPSLAVDDSVIYRRAAETNPELRAREHEAAREAVRARLAGTRYFPDLTLGVQHVVTGEARMPGVQGSGKDPWMVTLGINLPIHWGRYAAARREARAQHRAAQRKHDTFANDLNRRLARTLYDYHDSERKIDLYRQTLVPQAEELLGALTTAYLAGKADFLSFLDAQETLLDYRLRLARAQTDLAQRLAELEMLVGVPLDVARP